jgi:hypothetical protein
MKNIRSIGREKTMFRNIAAVVVAVGVLSGLSGRAEAWLSKNDAGTATAQFLKLGAGARAAGMGEAFTALADGANAVYWNPAGLARVEGGSLSVMHAAWFEGVTYDWASCARKVGKAGTVGIGVQYLSYGSIEGTDGTGLENGSFSPNDLAVSLSYGRAFRGVALGGNVKYISSKIKNSASAFAVDLGAMYTVNARLDLAAAVQNLGTGMKFGSEEESLPLNVKVGGAYAVRENWKATADVIAQADNELLFALGTEYGLRINETMSAAGRLGYNTRTRDTGGLNGVSVGLGFSYRGYAFDYAFVPYGDLGNTQRISLGIAFK